MGQPFCRTKNLSRLTIVKRQTTSRRTRRDQTDRPSKGLKRQVRRHPQHRVKRPPPLVETVLKQALAKALAFKVDCYMTHIVWDRCSALPQQIELPGLCHRMIYLKHLELRIRIAIRKGVQPRPKHHILRRTRLNSTFQSIFDKPAARHQKRPQTNRKRPIRPIRCSPKILRIRSSQNPNRQRVLKHQRTIQNLVRRPSKSHAQGSPRRNGRVH